MIKRAACKTIKGTSGEGALVGNALVDGALVGGALVGGALVGGGCSSIGAGGSSIGAGGSSISTGSSSAGASGNTCVMMLSSRPISLLITVQEDKSIVSSWQSTASGSATSTSARACIVARKFCSLEWSLRTTDGRGVYTKAWVYAN